MDAFDVMKRMTTLKREDFFGSSDADLPIRKSTFPKSDDFVPQFGFIGSAYEKKRILLLAAQPGNGKDDRREPWDEEMIPRLAAFYEDPTRETWRSAMEAYMWAGHDFPFWQQDCAPLLDAIDISIEEIAFANSLPWRSGGNRKVAAAAATLVVAPLLRDLRPNIVVALVPSRTCAILKRAGIRCDDDRAVRWSRNRNPSKKAVDRAAAADEIRRRIEALP